MGYRIPDRSNSMSNSYYKSSTLGSEHSASETKPQKSA